MNETITDTHRIIFKHLYYFNKLIETISLSNNTIENKAILISRVKNMARSLISYVKNN